MMNYDKRFTIKDAEAQGFTIDRTVYPHAGYKGPRFSPTEIVLVYTDLESDLIQIKPSRTLAEAVQKAAALREASYDKDAADKAEAEASDKRALQIAGVGAYFDNAIDYLKFYKLSFKEAAKQAAEELGDPALANPVYFALFSHWNDITDWAEEVLK